MLKRILAISLLALVGIPAAQGLEAPDLSKKSTRPDLGPDYVLGMDVWRLRSNGHMQVEGGDRIVVPSNTERDEGSNVVPLWAQVERIGPYFPNFRLRTYRYRYATDINCAKNFAFAGMTYGCIYGIKASLDVFAVGLLAYYKARPFASDNVEAEYGFELRRFGGEIGFAGEDVEKRAPSEVKYDITGEVISYLPLGHVGIAFAPPGTRLHLSLSGEALKIGDYAYYDSRVLVQFRLSRLVLGVGYRHTFFGGMVEVDDTDIGMHAKGAFLRLGYTM